MQIDDKEIKKIKGNLHWVSKEDSIECKFILYDFPTLNISVTSGHVEKSIQEVAINSIVQFERLGYFKIEKDCNHILQFTRICEL